MTIRVNFFRQTAVVVGGVIAFSIMTAPAQNFDTIPAPDVNPAIVRPQDLSPAPAPVAPANLTDMQRAAQDYVRGWREAHQGKYQDAVDDLTAAIKLRPKFPLAFAWRAFAYANLGKADEAKADMDQAEQTAATNALLAVNFTCARACLALGQKDKALAYVGLAKLNTSKQTTALNNFAWFLATTPLDDFRDGKKAVELATKACTNTKWERPFTIDTLAAAYAERGDFDNAVKMENMALGMPNFNPDMATGMQGRLALYQAHKPFRKAYDQDPGFAPASATAAAAPAENAPVNATVDPAPSPAANPPAP